MQPHQLRVPRQVRDLWKGRPIVPTREDPPDMSIEEAFVTGRVHIVLGVRVKVVMTVLGRPPEHALLCRRLGAERQDELEHPAGAEGAVRK